MPVLSEKTWERHSNPWSGWTRVLSLPLIFVPIWYHNLYGLIAVIIWFAINPFIFPKPKSTDNWMSKSIFGEKLWTDKYRLDFPQLLNVLNGVFFIITIYASYYNMFWHVFYSVMASFIFKMWYLDRMVFYFEADEVEMGTV